METLGRVVPTPVTMTSDILDRPLQAAEHESMVLKLSAGPPSATVEEQLKEAESIISRLPSEQKSAYMEAQSFSLDLIHRESDPSKFLRRYNGDVEAASHAMASYWTKRKEIFGDRFLLSMDLTEDGAMTSDDFKVLESCSIMNLPVSKEGRSVLCFDLSRLEKDMYSDACRLRIYFYMCQVASEIEKSQSEGVVIIIFIDSASFRLKVDSLLQLVEQTLSMRTQAVHIVLRLSEDVPIAKSLETVKLAFLQSCGGKDVEDRVCLHLLGIADKDPPTTLIEAGFLQKDLPTCIQGTWSDFDYQFWRMTRVALERAKKASFVPIKLGAADASSRKRLKQSANTQDGNQAKQATNEAPKTRSPVPRKLGPLPSMPDPDSGYCRLAEIEHAISSLSDDMNLKQAYMEAKELDSDLVKTETDPMGFIFASKFDIGRAALRLVSNWKKRKELFEKRAFLPMTQTGEGALSRGDLAALSSGVLLILPNDSQGRAVIYYDCSKVGEADRDSLRRVAFYMFSVASEISVGHGRGVVILMSVESVNDMVIGKCSFLDILEVLPCQVEALHVICFQALLEEPSATRGQFVNLASEAFGAVPENRLIVHMDYSRSEVLEKLQVGGLSRTNLPKSVGGCWGVERFVEWCELRTRFEWGLPPAASHKGVEKVFDFSKIKPPSQLEESDRIERARRMNVLHSRRKRERERIEIDVLHEQSDELRSHNRELQRENDRLEVLLRSAERVIVHQARHPQEELTTRSNPISNSFFAPDANDMFGANGGSLVPLQPPTAQGDHGVISTFPKQAFAPHGQLMLTTASGAPYCFMPGSVFGAGMHLQSLPFLPQQHVFPSVNFHYPTTAPFLMPVPLACQSGIAPPQSFSYSLPRVTAAESYKPMDMSGNASQHDVASHIPGDHTSDG